MIKLARPLEHTNEGILVHLTGPSDLALQGPEARRFAFDQAKEAGLQGYGLNRFTLGPRQEGLSTGSWLLVTTNWNTRVQKV